MTPIRVVLAAAAAVALLAQSCEPPPEEPPPTTTTTTEATTTTTEAPTTTTTEPSSPAEPVGDTYVRTAWPHDATTGPEVLGLDEDTLPLCRPANPTGLWSISATTTVEGCRHDGRITVKSTAPGTVLRGVVVEAAAAGSPVVLNESSDLLIEASIIGGRPGNVGPQGQACGAAVAYGRYTLRTSEVRECADGVKLTGTVVLDRNYVHSLSRTCGADGCSHNDGAQRNDNTPGEVYLTMTGNAWYLNSCTSNRLLQAPSLTASTFHIEGNFVSGSHGVANVDKDATSGNTGTITDNTLAGTKTAGPFSAREDGSQMSPGLFTGAGLANVDRSGNVYEDGSPVDPDGVEAPYTCGAIPPPS